jgi:hypothetical protein
VPAGPRRPCCAPTQARTSLRKSRITHTRKRRRINSFHTLENIISVTPTNETTFSLFAKTRGVGATPPFPKWNSRISRTREFVGAGLAPPGRCVLPKSRREQTRMPRPANPTRHLPNFQLPPFDFQVPTFNSLQIFCSFHFPRRNKITPAIATTISAATIETYTPFCPKCA